MGYPKYFKEVTDCSMCPFFTDYEMYSFRCNGDPNYSCPCMNMEEYGDMTILGILEQWMFTLKE